MKPTIQTYSGGIIDFTKPDENVFTAVDISVGLSNTCRYGGQCLFHYSVALHAVITSHLAPAGFEWECLHHDDTEAYMCDIPSPLKMLLPEYKALERGMDRAIRRQYGIPLDPSPEMKHADALALSLEKPILTQRTNMDWSSLVPVPDYAKLMRPMIQEITPRVAREMWLERYSELHMQRLAAELETVA